MACCSGPIPVHTGLELPDAREQVLGRGVVPQLRMRVCGVQIGHTGHLGSVLVLGREEPGHRGGVLGTPQAAVVRPSSEQSCQVPQRQNSRNVRCPGLTRAGWNGRQTPGHHVCQTGPKFKVSMTTTGYDGETTTTKQRRNVHHFILWSDAQLGKSPGSTPLKRNTGGLLRGRRKTCVSFQHKSPFFAGSTLLREDGYAGWQSPFQDVLVPSLLFPSSLDEGKAADLLAGIEAGCGGHSALTSPNVIS